MSNVLPGYPIYEIRNTLAAVPAIVAVSAPARVYRVFFTFTDRKYTDMV